MVSSQQLRVIELEPTPAKMLRGKAAMRFSSAEKSDEIFPILVEELVDMGFKRALVSLVDFESGEVKPAADLNCSRNIQKHFTATLWSGDRPMISVLVSMKPEVIPGPSGNQLFYAHPLVYRDTRMCWEAQRERGRECLAVKNFIGPPKLDLASQVCRTCNMRAYAAVVFCDVSQRQHKEQIKEAASLIELSNRTYSRLFKVEHYYNRMLDMEAQILQRDAVMMSMAEPVILTDSQLRVITQNRAAEKFFKIPDENVSEGAMRAFELNNLLFSATVSSLAVSSKESSKDLTLVDVKFGEEVLFEAVCAPTYSPSGLRTGLVTVLRNITDLRRADLELKENLRKLREAEEVVRQDRDRLDLVIRNVGDAIIVADKSAKIVLTDRLAQELLGLQNIPEAKEDAATNPKMINNRASIDAFLQEFTFFSLGQTETRTMTLFNPRSGADVEYEVRSGKILDTRGQVSHSVTVFRDFSTWKKLEQLRMERKMLEFEKFAATGRLAGTIAHEVNNPMEAIKNAIHLLGDHVNGDGKEIYEILETETKRVARIIRQMLGLYRHGGKVQTFELNPTIEDTLALFARQLNNNGVKVEARLEQLPELVGSSDQVRQLLSNLVVNANDSMQGGGTLHIRTRHIKRDEGLRGVIRLTVADTGGGIPREIQETMFEPFVSTKGERGTGLGLWIVKGILDSHSGRLKVRSRMGKGTIFRIDFPVIR